MSQLYIRENLGRKQPLVHKILGRQESIMPMQNHANADSNADANGISPIGVGK